MRAFLIAALALSLLTARQAHAQFTQDEFSARLKQLQNSFLNKPFPEFRWETIGGRTWSDDSLKGRITIVEVSAAGCGPCLNAVKYFNAIRDSLSRRGIQYVSLFKDNDSIYHWIFSDKKRGAFRGGVMKYQYQAPEYDVVLMQTNSSVQANTAAAEKLAGIGFPLFLIVDQEGIVRYVKLGFSGSDDIHWERKAEAPFSNSTIRKLMAAVDTL